MKNIVRIAALALVLIGITATLFGCAGGKAQATPDALREKGVVRIGVFSDKPPFGYVDENGQNQGYDVYLARRLAKDLLGDESKVEFVLVEAANRVEYLEANKVDIILANFTVTPERQEKVDFALPYMRVALGVVSPDGKPVTTVEDLAGKTLIVNRGTTADAYFTKNHPEITLLKFDQNTEAFNALKDGRGDALAHDNTLVYAWVAENSDFSTTIDSIGNQDFIAPAVQKGNAELLAWLNEEMEVLTQEGFFEKDFEETLRPIYGNTVDSKNVLVD